MKFLMINDHRVINLKAVRHITCTEHSLVVTYANDARDEYPLGREVRSVYKHIVQHLYHNDMLMLVD